MSLPDDIEQVVGPKTFTLKQVVIIVGWVVAIGLFIGSQWVENIIYQKKLDDLATKHDKDILQLSVRLDKEEDERKQSISLLWQKYGTLNENN